VHRGTIGELQMPDCLATGDRHDLGAGLQGTAASAQLAQIALVQGMDIDVHGHRIEQCPMDQFASQAGQHRDGLVPVKQSQSGTASGQFCLLRMQLVLLTGLRQVQCATRREQRDVGESLGRMQVELPAGASQRAHPRRSVTLHEHRRGPAGRVVTGLRLAFEQHHLALRRQLRGDRRARDARANDGNIENGVLSHVRYR